MTDAYQVGPFQLDPDTSLLTLSGEPVALGRRAADLLTALVSAPQQWITKARLLEAAWPGLVVEESNLAVQVFALRRALARAPGGDRWIETLVGRGYRFVGPVQAIPRPRPAQATSSPAARNHSLPAEVDTFVGRADVLEEISSAFTTGARVVSVVGTGGVGKTRLAQRFGWAHLSRFSGGSWFCDLSAARNVDAIARAVARGLDVPLNGDDSLAYVTRVISERGECLVILDNFEQVAPYAAETVNRWAERAPKAHFLVTTRELLGLPGERALALGPLETDDAATLFLQRASASESMFAPKADDRSAILELANLLDRLPLAIELAAARVRVLPPRSLLERMDRRFTVLPSAHGRSDRHATLRATFDWSWDLLDSHERTALARLSVFERGFTLEAAEAVLDPPGSEDGPSAIDLVQALVDKSLVPRSGENRFALLDTIKAYASERLETDPQCGGPAAARSAKARHYRFFATVEERFATAERGADIDNLVAACERAAEDEDAESATGALVRAWQVLVRTGPYRAALELADSVRSMRGLNDAQNAMVDWVVGMALFSLGRSGEAKSSFERGLVASRTAGDRHAECLLLRGLADQFALEGRIDEALARAGEALAIAEQLHDPQLQCGALNRLGAAFWRGGRLAEAKQSYAKALQLAQATRDRRMQGALIGNLGIVHHDLGELHEARRLYEESLQCALELGDRQGEAAERGNLADLSLEQGAIEDARVQFEAIMSIGRFLGHARTECVSRNGLGGVFMAKGDYASASEQYRLAAELAHETGDRRAEGRMLIRLGVSLAHVGAASEARDRFTTAEALLSGIGDPASRVELYCRWADAALLSRDSATAAELIRRAEEALLAVDSPSPIQQVALLQRVRSMYSEQSTTDDSSRGPRSS